MKNKRDFCISATRKILQDKKISFKEMESSTGTFYFRHLLETSTPCLRLADHKNGKRKPSVSFYFMVGDHAKEKQIRKRLENVINNMITRSKIGKTLDAINKIGEQND